MQLPGNKRKKVTVKNKKAVKATTLILVIAVTIILKVLKLPALAATVIALVFGFASIGIMIFSSARSGKMIHCLKYCPVGTLVIS